MSVGTGNATPSEADSVSIGSINFDGDSQTSITDINEAIRLSVLMLLDNPDQLATLPEEERQRILTVASQMFPTDNAGERVIFHYDGSTTASDETETGDEVNNDENLVRTMLVLHGEMGPAFLTEMPGSDLFELLQSIVTLLVGTAGAQNDDELGKCIELLKCSSSVNIIRRLEAWQTCYQRLSALAAPSEFNKLFADTMQQLAERHSQDDLHPAVGEYRLGLCDICCSTTDTLLWSRGCCQTSACIFCLNQWLMNHLTDVHVELACPGCSVVLTISETRHLLREDAMSRREKLLARVRNSTRERDCPKCSCLAQRPANAARRKLGKRGGKKREKEEGGTVVKCVQCNYLWCFDCHGPVHPGMTCRQHRSGAQQLKSWANKMENSGLRKARRCPKCKVMIEKNDGCNHMTCAHCRHEFCYVCKKRWHVREVRIPYFGWSVFGDHSSRLSIFGCRQNFMSERPSLRRFIRGILFVLRTCGLIVVPTVAVAILLPIALALLGVAIPLAPIIVPAVLIYLKYRKKAARE